MDAVELSADEHEQRFRAAELIDDDVLLLLRRSMHSTLDCRWQRVLIIDHGRIPAGYFAGFPK